MGAAVPQESSSQSTIVLAREMRQIFPPISAKDAEKRGARRQYLAPDL